MNLYLVVGVAVGGLLLSGGIYFKGRQDGAAAIYADQLQEYRKLIAQEDIARRLRTEADDKARREAERFVENVRRDLNEVRDDFSGIPMVTIGGDGCADLNDAFRLRWNSTESAGDVRPSTGEPSKSM